MSRCIVTVVLLYLSEGLCNLLVNLWKHWNQRQVLTEPFVWDGVICFHCLIFGYYHG